MNTFKNTLFRLEDYLLSSSVVTGGFLFLLFCLFALWGIEASLVIQHSDFASFQAASPDEAMMLDVLTGGSAAHFASGYGPAFWGVLWKALSLAPDENKVAFVRFVFVSFKYVAFLSVALALWLRHVKLAAVLFLFLCLSSPGFLFFGKIVSPEYLVLFYCSLTFVFLLHDAGRFGSYHFAAIVCAWLAFMAKISLLPFACAVTGYGVLALIIESKTIQYKKIAYHSLKAVLAAMVVIVPVFTLCSWPEAIKQVSDILSLTPPLRFSMEMVHRAWEQHVYTWDQIMFFGLRDSFYAALLSLLLSIGVLVCCARYHWRQMALPFLFLLTASVLLLTQVFHGIAASWYLFPFAFVSFFTLALLLPQISSRKALLCACVFLGLFALHDARLCVEQIAFKYHNNQQLTKHKLLMDEVYAYLAENEPWAKTGSLDILVPTTEEQAIDLYHAQVKPVRVSLREAVEDRMVLPDYVIINRSAVSGNSPLLIHVLKKKIEAYQLIKSFDDLDLYLLNKKQPYLSKEK